MDLSSICTRETHIVLTRIGVVDLDHALRDKPMETVVLRWGMGIFSAINVSYGTTGTHFVHQYFTIGTAKRCLETTLKNWSKPGCPSKEAHQHVWP